MHYVELDVNNLRRWLSGTTSAVRPQRRVRERRRPAPTARWTSPASSSTSRTAAATATSAATTRRTAGPRRPVTGGVEVFYGDDDETGELGFEDIINTDANSRRTGTLDHCFTDADGNNRFSEDLNWELRLVPAASTRQDAARSRPTAACRGCCRAAPTGCQPMRRRLTGTDSGRRTRRMAPVGCRRRHRRLRHADRPERGARQPRLLLPARAEARERRPRQPAGQGAQGLTVAAENPVYVAGATTTPAATRAAAPAANADVAAPAWSPAARVRQRPDATTSRRRSSPMP